MTISINFKLAEMSNSSPHTRVTRREPKFPDQGRRMSSYKLKRTNTLSSSIESGFYAVDNDITQLKEVTERSLLSTLKSRFASDFIYTYAGPILISINPYHYLPIYNPKYIKFYQGAKMHELPPHVFAIADAAYQSMLKEGRNQCVVIGGESGSGKTETTKFLLNHLTSLSGMLLPQDILDHIIYAGPILEAFGNATTLDNHNSSRFGKYITLCFKENGTYRGAYIEKYLLEQCRIVSQAEGERNFHVFYYLLNGASEQMKEELFLDSNTQYGYLSSYSSIKPSKQDSEGYTRLCNLLTSLKFQDHIQFNIFSILSAILHLGNLTFTESETSLNSNTVRELTLVSQLLKVPLELLTQTLTHRQKSVGYEKIVTPCTSDQKAYTRDALAKALYSSLFDWILFKINDILNGRVAKREYQLKTIGILDIFGFENVRRNSFEQFCINYANEQLHHYFINFVLKLEQDEYVNDKIDWRHITYKDNIDCINLFAKRPNGLFILINDESSIPRGTDLTLFDKFILNHRTNSYFKTPQLKQQSPIFTVAHFAGAVTYHIGQFLEKNKDLMCKNVVDLLHTSGDRLIRELIGVEPIGNVKWRKLGLVFKAATLFKSSIAPKITSPPPLPPRRDGFRNPPPTLHPGYPRSATEGQVAGSKSAMPFRQMNSNRREGEMGNCIRFIQSYNPETPRRRISSKRRSKKSSERKTAKAKVQVDSRPRFNSFDVQELRGAPTVVSQYQTSLSKLMEQLSIANPYFIKCLRSNTNQQPRHFNDEAVKHQLNYSGLFEAIRVRQAGYSIRMPFGEFLKKYQPLIGPTNIDGITPAVLVSDFLRQQYLPLNSYQIGESKVFIREMEGQRLDDRLNMILLQRVIFLQKSVRSWLDKRRFVRFKKSLIEVQAGVRGFLARSLVQKKLNAVVSIQSVWRGFIVRKAIFMMKQGKSEYKNLLRNSFARKCLQNGDFIMTKSGDRVSYPPGKEKLKNRRSLFEGDLSPQRYTPIMRGSATLSITNSNPFRHSYMEAIQKQHNARFESRDNDSSKYNLGRVKLLYKDNVMSPLRTKVRSESMDASILRPGSVNDIVKVLDVKPSSRCQSAQKRSSKTISRCNFSEPMDNDYIFAPGIAKSPVSYSKSCDFSEAPFAPVPPPRIAPKEIFNKLLKTHSSYLNNLPLDRETIFKQTSSLHFMNRTRFNSEMFKEKLITPLPTNYNHARVKRSRAKPVVRREAIRVTSPSVERPHVFPSSPLTPGYNFFPKIIQEDDSTNGMTTSHLTRKKRESENVKVKSISDISPFELIFHGKNQLDSSSQPYHKGSLILTRSAGNDYGNTDLRPRAVTVTTLNSGSRSLTRSFQMSREKFSGSPMHNSSTIQSKIYSLSPFKLNKPRKDKHERAKGKVQLTNYAHGHEPKPYVAFQRTSCSKCHRTLHPPFYKRCVVKCSLCSLVFHENCMQFANTCRASSGDVVIARNLSDLSELISFLLDKKDTLSERPRQKDTMDDFYILALERMHASMLTNTSLRAQAYSEETTQIKTQIITIGNVLHDFSLLLSPLVSDTKSQLVLRNVFMNLLEDFLLEKTGKNAGPNSTITPQAVKVLQRRKEKQKPRLICGHTFLEKHFNVLTVCELCNVPMSLVEPGQFCNTCDYVAHKSCLPSIKSHCTSNCDESIDLDATKTDKVLHFVRPLHSLPKSHTGLPKVFELCLKSIESTGLVAEGLYRKSSAKSKVTRLIAAINEDIDAIDWEEFEVHTVCSVLKNFLTELPDPLLTFDLYDKCILASKMTERAEKLRAIHAIIHLLPPIHYSCLERLIFHMAQVAKGEDHNKMSPKSLAIVFAPVLLKTPDDMPLIELAKMVPFQTEFLQSIIEEQLKKFRDTMQDLEQLDRDKRDTIRKMKQLTQDDNKSDSGIFDQHTHDDVTQTIHWKRLNNQLTEIESQKFSLTIELARLELGESSNEDSSSHDSIEATI